MRELSNDLTIGQRIAYYRKRRGLTQTELAASVDKGDEWLRKVETDRRPIDRVSVLLPLAKALSVTLGDLLGERVLLDWDEDAQRSSVPALRVALTDWRFHLPGLNESVTAVPDLGRLELVLNMVWADYQDSRYGRVADRLPELVTTAATSSRLFTGDLGRQAKRLSATVHQLATVYLTKLGESDLALLAAGRGLDLAQQAGDPATIASLFRSNAHALAAIGEFDQSVALASHAATRLARVLHRPDATGDELSTYGMLYLVGGLAAAKVGDANESRSMLREAERVASQLGEDGNYLWTAFGPTNVAIHEVAASVELNNVPRALELASRVDASALPIERRGRHAIETARAFAMSCRLDDSIQTLLEAEMFAAEQIRHHVLSREIVRQSIRRRTSNQAALDLAGRMGVTKL